ncbi:30S ribosomal protein S17 [Candidatus Uhrbacteria bacterium CG_4_9_14_3_um_filter_36_7]|uniref:Small ribosomal subunit protein uS17 n=1 Tax=Candidatus Uhrbacteria bacterium CG_4_9_14_3_um_filter_36_7 TaxID=1975033 RepID=A0A2M7XHM3_9BACT|nr:MAG: 30S ribosomal protein S17 [Candidatus Uhrbacteria bacterium CG_4_9_14_3_um_filter_36_7]
MTHQFKKNQTKGRVFTGTVVSCAMQKTIVVRVERTVRDRKYKKARFLSKNYKVHHEDGQYNTGDKVAFEECRPLSKEKRWRILPSQTLNSTN